MISPVLVLLSVTSALAFKINPIGVRFPLRKVAPVESQGSLFKPREATSLKAFTGLEGPAVVQALHTILAMNFMPLGPVAYGLGMGGKSMNAAQQKWGDRTFMNMMEQAPLFSAALWLHAYFVDAVVATKLGFA